MSEQEFKRALGYANSALDLLKRGMIPPYPQFYELLYTYATGESPTDGNTRNVEVLLGGWRQGRLTLKELVRQLVLSKTFRYKLARTEAP